MVSITHVLKDHAYQNVPLRFDEAYELGQYVLDGCAGDSLAQIQSVAALCALHNRATYAYDYHSRPTDHGHSTPSDASGQIAGICAAIFELDIAKSEFGFASPNIPYAMDNSGMGGDLVVTANVSTLSALIAATAGLPVCKHGSPANADGGRHGSSDFIGLLGLNQYNSRSEVEACLENEHFAYIEALDVRFKRVHTQTHLAAHLPHMNDIIGPITNPLNPKLLTRRVLGINHLMDPALVAKAYQILNDHGITALDHGLFVRGYIQRDNPAGMDELSLCPGGTLVAELKDGMIRQYRVYAHHFETADLDPAQISPRPGQTKGDLSLGILTGEIGGAPLQMVLANAALLFYLDDPSKTFKRCFDEAKEVHASGQVTNKVSALRERIPAPV